METGTITSRVLDTISFHIEMELSDVDFNEFFSKNDDPTTRVDRDDVRGIFNELMNLKILQGELKSGVRPTNKALFDRMVEEVMDRELDDVQPSIDEAANTLEAS